MEDDVHTLKRVVQLMAVGAFLTVPMASVATAAEHDTCGVYRYHEHEDREARCVDARQKPSGKSWGQDMLDAQGKWHQ